MKKTLIYILFFLTLSQLTAQNTGENTLGTWYEITASNRISDKFSISGSLTNWNYQFLENQHIVLAIVGLNYHINKNVSVGLNYANGSIDTSFEETNTPYLKENRIIEQLFVKHKVNKFSLSHRFRVEQRFLEYETFDTLKNRIRYRFKSIYPLNKNLSLTFYDEIHYHLDNGAEFHQNRAYLGFGTKINKNMSLELGYAKHTYKTKSFDRLSLQLNLKFDFRKKN